MTPLTISIGRDWRLGLGLRILFINAFDSMSSVTVIGQAKVLGSPVNLRNTTNINAIASSMPRLKFEAAGREHGIRSSWPSMSRAFQASLNVCECVFASRGSHQAMALIG